MNIFARKTFPFSMVISVIRSPCFDDRCQPLLVVNRHLHFLQHRAEDILRHVWFEGERFPLPVVFADSL